MKKRDLISIQELNREEIEHLVEMAISMKNGEISSSWNLRDKSVALVFQKPSNRTRVSFEIGIWQLGGKCMYLSPREINLGKRESTADVAKTLSRYVDCIVARTHSHKDIVDLARHSSVSVVNALSDSYHPCQALADILTVKEKFADQKNVMFAYIGDGNNVCHSLLLGCSKVGINMSVATPKGYEPKQEIIDCAKQSAHITGATIQLTNEPSEAIQSANVIYTDTWISMGQEEEEKARLKTFKNFQINAQSLENASADYIFMHCLPAHRGQEVTNDIIDSEHSVVFDQAENRMHIQKAILLFLLKNK